MARKKRKHPHKRPKMDVPTEWATLPEGVPKLVAGKWLIRFGNRVGVLSEARVAENIGGK